MASTIMSARDLLNFCTTKDVLTPQDGYLAIPTEPGLGIGIDEDAVREADKDRHRWRNPVWRSRTGALIPLLGRQISRSW